MKPDLSNEPMLISNKSTFASVLNDHWEEIACFWNGDTQESYIKDYKELILPHFKNHPLEYYDDVSHFDDIIEIIRKSGTRRDGIKSEYSPATLRHFRHLMRRVVKVAALHGICPDVLWGTTYVDSENEDPDQAVAEEKTRLHKSLLPREEYDLADMVFHNPLQDGEKMVALLGFAQGTRPQESAAVNWAHIIPISEDSDKHVLAILTTVDQGDGGDGSKLGGKTRNMFRFVPISKRLYAFLMERKRHIQAQIDSGTLVLNEAQGVTSVDQLPIACEGGNYAKRCNLRKASNVCKEILRSIGISETLYQYLAKEADISHEISVWGREKDVILYLLRRNFGTHLHNLGLSMEEIQYLMGHKIGNPLIKRSDFRNADIMNTLWDKLSLRPVLNDLPKLEEDEFVF